VQPWPPPDADDPLQLGVYDGIPRPARTVATADHLDHVVLFQRPHEIACADDAALREEIRKTVVHELAHHFGLEDGALGDYE